ncbi:circadian clock KaiB family protein [Paludisphaera soli]|uniref:circadian clock KaiB family protein n=1 Tax=Paludisphaera soli TaxID=2712865 RepID=UPI0013EA48AA|nr:circadian clock KaiB family protein [Paludisphaera soli]
MNDLQDAPPEPDASAAGPETWELRLYVAGRTPRCLVAIANLKKICEEHLCGRYWIEVIDLATSPQLAKAHEIVAIPTLVRTAPLPKRKVIGDLSDVRRVLAGLEVEPTPP